MKYNNIKNILYYYMNNSIEDLYNNLNSCYKDLKLIKGLDKFYHGKMSGGYMVTPVQTGGYQNKDPKLLPLVFYLNN
jgi:hypothetical protein